MIFRFLAGLYQHCLVEGREGNGAGDWRRKSLQSSSVKHLLTTFSHFIPPVAARREGIHWAECEGGQAWGGIRDSLHCCSIRHVL